MVVQYPFVDGFAALAPRITGGTSVISSTTLIYLIMRSDVKLYTIYHRIMFGMSIADVLASTAMSLSTLPMPTEMKIDYGFVGMRLGNAQTCRAQGFFFVFGVTAMYAYNGALCVYYACVIAFKMKEQTIRKRLEPYMHLVPISLAFSVGLPPLFFDSYWATGWEGWCTFAPGDSMNDSRRDTIRNISSIVLMVLILAILTIVVSSFYLIISRILHTQRILRNAAMISRTSNGSDSFLRRRGQLLNSVTEASDTSKVIFVQAIAYICAFLVTLSTPLIHTLIGDREEFWVIKLQVILVPLQGLFNLFIYIGHRIYNYRRVHPGVTKCEVFRKLFTGNANDDTLFTRISLIEIDSNERNMEVRVENENNDVELISIQLRENNNHDIQIEAPRSSSSYVDNGGSRFEELSSIHLSGSSRDHEISYNDSFFQASTIHSSKQVQMASSISKGGWWMNRLQNQGDEERSS